MTTTTDPSKVHSGIGGKRERHNWHFLGKQYQIVYETIGQGNPVLLRW